MTHILLLFAALIFLVIASSFFSGSETGMMAINRYRLRHLMRKQHLAAKRVNQLLERPDRLLGVILIGNTFTNMLASAIASLIAIQLFGDIAVVPATLLLALIVLIFAEITPKTLAVMYPERLSFAASGLLTLLLRLLYPLVWCGNTLSNGLLRLFNIKVTKKDLDYLTGEEVRTLVHEATPQLFTGYKRMMLGVLDLGGITVDDIKVPRHEIVGLDLEDAWPLLLEHLATVQHTRLPLYCENIDQVQGIVHLRKALNLAAQGELNKEKLLEIAEEVYFIPDGTPLNIQLVNFRQEKHRIGLVVDEYGDIQGLVTLDDILEEIVGEYTTNLTEHYQGINPQRDGSYLVDGSISIRELNRQLKLELPVQGPKTLSGLVVEHLETIPESPIGLRLAGYPMEVVEMEENMIKLVRIFPELRKPND